MPRGDRAARLGAGRVRRPRRVAARARRGLRPGLHRPREHLAERRAARVLARGHRGADRPHRRVLRAGGVHRRPGQGVQLRHVPAARLRDRRAPRRRRPPDRRDPRRRGRVVPAQVPEADLRADGAGRDARARLARPDRDRARLRPRGGRRRRAEGVRRAGRRGPPPLPPDARHGDRRVAVAQADRRGRDAAGRARGPGRRRASAPHVPPRGATARAARGRRARPSAR